MKGTRTTQEMHEVSQQAAHLSEPPEVELCELTPERCCFLNAATAPVASSSPVRVESDLSAFAQSVGLCSQFLLEVSCLNQSYI